MKRYALHAEKETVEKMFGVESTSQSLFDPSYNIFPGSAVPIIYKNDKIEISSAIWGINDKQKIVNFAFEDVLENSPVVKDLELLPCVIPASGFYLWKQSVEDQYPFYIRMLSRRVLGIAGLYRRVTSKKRGTVLEFASIIKTANVLLQPLEPFMPCILDPENFNQWILNGEKNILQSQFKTTELIPDLAVYRVPELVNDPAQNSKELIQAIPKLREEDD